MGPGGGCRGPEYTQRRHQCASYPHSILIQVRKLIGCVCLCNNDSSQGNEWAWDLIPYRYNLAVPNEWSQKALKHFYSALKPCHCLKPRMGPLWNVTIMWVRSTACLLMCFCSVSDRALPVIHSHHPKTRPLHRIRDGNVRSGSFSS